MRLVDEPYSLLCSMLMTGTVISTADCGIATFGANSDSDSSSESSESLSESYRIGSSQPTDGVGNSETHIVSV